MGYKPMTRSERREVRMYLDAIHGQAELARDLTDEHACIDESTIMELDIIAEAVEDAMAYCLSKLAPEQLENISCAVDAAYRYRDKLIREKGDTPTPPRLPARQTPA